ncbi:MAG: hypothetical protein ABSE39_08365 [Candidatus Bathyarchaeia archaeon]
MAVQAPSQIVAGNTFDVTVLATFTGANGVVSGNGMEGIFIDQLQLHMDLQR